MAIGSLGELRDPRAISLLLPLASNSDWQIRHRVAQALGNFLDGEQVRSTLEQLAADEQDVVASTAKYSLGLS
ncbi:HEAT repeat domain-containing protein [[Phormidium] sp. ETS-05]|uniref:HEAT repeat domain-containing protein n=1 Tax=[Phormidium] sp. ETS-05 TaxID=222819 RepID=UPI0031FED93E